MSDKIELIGNSLIQHGKENNRVYLMKTAKEDYPEIGDYVESLAINDGYTKIVAKVPSQLKSEFSKNGYVSEAYIKNFYNGKEDVYFLSKYFSKERQDFKDEAELKAINQICFEKRKSSATPELNKRFFIKQLDKKHISQMIELYKNVFESYPFPIFDGSYILKTMHENVDYYGVFENDKLIAISSSEMDIENKNTEMTDFATLPEYRGENLSYHLLKKMEKGALQKHIKTFYTISRAKNYAINIIFAKSKYEFGGTLVNNTNICGNIETMNVWYKTL